MQNANQKQKAKPKGRPLASTNQETRKNLLDAAVMLFAKQGVSATSLAQIASHANLTPAMIHYYFKTREQLIEAVVRERVMNLISILWQDMDWLSGSPVEMVSLLIDHMIDAAEQMPWLPELWIKEMVTEGGQLRPILVSAIRKDNVAQILKTIKRWQDAGVFHSDIHPYYFFNALVTTVMTPLCVHRRWLQFVQKNPDKDYLDLTREALSKHCKTMLIHGILVHDRA